MTSMIARDSLQACPTTRILPGSKPDLGRGSSADPIDDIGSLAKIASQRFAAQLNKRTAAFEVTATRYSILWQLWIADGIPQRPLSLQLGISESTLAVSIQEMADSGLLRQEINGSNRRETLVFLTENGRKLEAMLPPFFHIVDQSATEGLSPAEILVLRSLLQRVADNLRLFERKTSTASDWPFRK